MANEGSPAALVEYVPYLRRFARALTGNQTLGDGCVVAALERVPLPRPSGNGEFVPILLQKSALEKAL